MVLLNRAHHHGASFAFLFPNAQLARLEAHQFLQTQPERTVYMHYSFMAADSALSQQDNGPVAWQRDGWTVAYANQIPAPGVRGFVLLANHRHHGQPMEQILSTTEHLPTVSVAPLH